ncbi:hypothetical protein FA13DRAFT_1872464 [Coprinellus micaceus]|uniref:Uncharacterized protein n=1 Tax=Coprinellus micaceus TaxID=71717 RepID=A0A4Y7T309_COPMI|nr:hypothetical protein FA13DRAFT_1872464 [Coprinellus micaceus]
MSCLRTPRSPRNPKCTGAPGDGAETGFDNGEEEDRGSGRVISDTSLDKYGNRRGAVDEFPLGKCEHKAGCWRYNDYNSICELFSVGKGRPVGRIPRQVSLIYQSLGLLRLYELLAGARSDSNPCNFMIKRQIHPTPNPPYFRLHACVISSRSSPGVWNPRCYTVVPSNPSRVTRGIVANPYSSSLAAARVVWPSLADEVRMLFRSALLAQPQQSLSLVFKPRSGPTPPAAYPKTMAEKTWQVSLLMETSNHL